MPALLSSLIGVPREDLSAALAADGPARPCLREWLTRIPDPRSPLGRWHPLEFVLALAVCAFTAAGHDSPSAIADWASGCSRETLAALGGHRDGWTREVRPPCERTFRRVFARVGEAALNNAVHGYLAAMPQAAPDELPEAVRHEREQRRAAAQTRKPPVPGLLPQAAADGKAVRGAARPDGSQVHLLSAFHVGEGRTLARREIGAKTNEIPELAPAIKGLDLAGMLVTLDALHTQRETARLIRADKGGHYLMIVKANQPTLLQQVTAVLKGTDAGFADASWPRTAKATAAGRSAASAPPPLTGSIGRMPPRSCASAATPAPPRARGHRRRSPTASPASRRTRQAPATWPSTPASTGESRTASIEQARHYDVSRLCGRDAGVGQGPAGLGGSG